MAEQMQTIDVKGTKVKVQTWENEYQNLRHQVPFIVFATFAFGGKDYHWEGAYSKPYQRGLAMQCLRQAVVKVQNKESNGCVPTA